MMMGREDLNNIDIESSILFFDNLAKNREKLMLGRVLDCGAGIGRVSE